MWIADDGEKMEDISHCFKCFDQFQKDCKILLDKGVIKHTAFDHYEWTKSKTSLAEYFKWIGDEEREKLETNQLNIQGGFWNSIAIVFRVNKRTLSRLASHNANPLKPKKSKDFKKIKELVLQYREKIKQQAEQERNDRKTFAAIKILIDEAEDHDIEKIRAALKKIKTVII